MSELLSKFPDIIASVQGTTGLIALLALLIFVIAVFMFSKEGTKVKLFVFATLVFVALAGIVASIEFETGKQYVSELKTEQYNDSAQDVNTVSDPVQPVSGLPAGSIVRQCGCWGFVNFGARDMEPTCASGWAQAVGCPTFCPAGGYQWMVQCL